MLSLRFRIFGVIFALIAGILAIRNLTHKTTVSMHAPVEAQRRSPLQPAFGKKASKEHQESRKVAEDFTTSFTIERLASEHVRVPTAEEWKELIRILLFAEDGELVNRVKARFSLHAGAENLESLIEIYETPETDNARQRIIEIFSTLHSGGFSQTARRILNDSARPITDHLVCACAFALVRNGETQDIVAILSRIHSTGEDPEPAGSLYSETDGLVYAISKVGNPELEQLFIDTAIGQTANTTGRARLAAVAALGNYHSVPVVELLHQLSQNDSREQVRKQAERSLKLIKRRGR